MSILKKFRNKKQSAAPTVPEPVPAPKPAEEAPVKFHKTHESCRFRRSICGQLEDVAIILDDLDERLTAIERRILSNGREEVYSDAQE